MQKISETAAVKNHPLNEGDESTQNSRRGLGVISRKWVDALFARFSRIWPSAWADVAASHNVDAIAEEWQAGLSGMTGEQIGRAIEQCRQQNIWPPTIAEFRAACAATPNAAMYRRNEEVLALPAKTWEERRAVGFEHIRRMKEQLRTP